MTLRWVSIGLLVALAVVLLPGVFLPRPLFEERLTVEPAARLVLAPDAFTFARVGRSDGPHLVLVTAASVAGVEGIDLTATLPGAPRAMLEVALDPRLRGLAADSTDTPRLRIPWADLGPPLDFGSAHIAAGANYPAHAEEVSHEGAPFLFPKLSVPTPWNATVERGGRLDYEVELCVAPLEDAVPGRTDVPLAFLLCNDFTDRWVLLQQIDLDAPMGTTGFPDAKGGATRLPVGALLVVPDDPGAFLASLELSLWWNGRLHQRSAAAKMIWKPEGILREALAACDTVYTSSSGSPRIAECDRIPAGTLVLTGTPEGVRFQPLNIWNPLAYPGSGDVVVSEGTHLGWLENAVVE